MPSFHSDNTATGKEMYCLMTELFPICRSITGNGVRQTLDILKKQIPITIFEVPSGTRVFDWTVPYEWNINDAYIADKNGNKIVDFNKNNLHIVGYSTPIDAWIPSAELQNHLHSLERQPDAIPYVTSYYKEYWGFCIAHNQRLKLSDDSYHVYIDSTLKPGALTYGELIIPGKTEEEIFLSTYICHPSMANNELSGPVVLSYLAKWICSQPRKYTYRIIFIPETIGSITYLSLNIEQMKKNIIAGFNISCVGDERVYSFVSSRYGNTLADKLVSNILSSKHPTFIKYSFLDRASDEKHYCSPGVDLPLVTICRSKFGTFPEYHTSLDNLDFVTPGGLEGSYELLRDCIQALEKNSKYKITCFGEPQLGKRGLYPNISTRDSTNSVRKMMDFIAYSDGKNDLIDISNLIDVPVVDLYPIIETLLETKLLVEQ
jgi:aminopeptidase-like protein